MLKYFGIIAILAGLVGVYSAYRKYAQRRLLEISSFIKLISGIKEEIEVYSRPLGSYLSSFHDEALEAAGFNFSDVDASRAYNSARHRLSVGARADLVLDGFFSGLGSSGRDTEIAKCSLAIDKLCSIEAEDAEAIHKNEISIGAISAAIGLSVTILII